ncbi:MAG: DUF169 domain-containing protein [Bacteroidales bacterium]
MILELKKQFGPKCLGLKVNYNREFSYSPEKSIRFCEAVNDAFRTPLLFNPLNLTCFGAKRGLGLLRDDKELLKHISAETNIAQQIIKKALIDIPKMSTPINNILMGITEEIENDTRPDMYIMYIDPKQLTDLTRKYILVTNEYPIVQPFPFLLICGNVFISTFKSARMSVSFGCPESREFGGLKDNQLVVGLPYNQAVQILS